MEEIKEDIEKSAELEDVVFELPSPHEDIVAAYNALSAVCDVDELLMNKAMAHRIRRIRNNAYIIIDEQLKYIHDCIMYEEEDGTDG